MAMPLQAQNVVGSLVLAASANSNSLELNLPIGTVISNGNSSTTTSVQCPAVPVSAIFLVQIGSGDATIVADTSATSTVSFASADKYQVTNTVDRLLALPVTTSATKVYVGLKITNTSGGNMTVGRLRLLVLSAFNPARTDWHSVRGGSLAGVTLGTQGTADGSFVLNT